MKTWNVILIVALVVLAFIALAVAIKNKKLQQSNQELMNTNSNQKVRPPMCSPGFHFDTGSAECVPDVIENQRKTLVIVQNKNPEVSHLIK